RSGESVWISAQVRSSGSPLVDLFYLYDATKGETKLSMLDDGLHRDGRAGDGAFGAEIPAFDGETEVLAHNTRVHLRIQARLGEEVADYPRPLLPGRPAPEEGVGFYVNDLQESALSTYHLLFEPGMTGANPNTLNNYLNCQTLRKGDFAFQGELYPEVGVRWRGNTACYIYKRNFKVVFNKGHYFHGLHKVNLNGLYTDKAMVRERLSWEFYRWIG